MTGRAELAYIQPRLQARHGRRPAEATWGLLEASKNLGHYLETARKTGLGRWTEVLSRDMERDALERSLRSGWRTYAEDLAARSPPGWRDAVGWTATLVDLPGLSHLLSGLPAPAWMRDDPVFAELALDDPSARHDALRASRFAPLVAAWEAERPLRTAWLAHWRRLWPSGSHRATGGLETLIGLFERHLTTVAAEASSRTDIRNLRASLDHALVVAFRKHSQRPAAIFCHLGLVALDLERLRDGLVRRATFPRRQGAAT